MLVDVRRLGGGETGGSAGLRVRVRAAQFDDGQIVRPFAHQRTAIARVYVDLTRKQPTLLQAAEI